MALRKQTLKEEVFNTISHGAGVVFCLIAIPILIYYALEKGHMPTVYSVSIFGFGMFMVYLSSTLFHAVQHDGAKRALQVWDHISIYLLIAGSYTPLVVKFIHNDTATLFLSVMWGIVLVGSILKIFFTGRFQLASTMLYLALGWMAVFIIKPFFNNVPLEVFLWLLGGGLFYTLGVYFYVKEHKPYHHAIWHCFVLAGTITHYVAIYISAPLQGVID